MTRAERGDGKQPRWPPPDFRLPCYKATCKTGAGAYALVICFGLATFLVGCDDDSLFTPFLYMSRFDVKTSLPRRKEKEKEKEKTFIFI